MQEQKRKKWPWIVGVAGAVLVAVLYLVLSGLNTPQRRVRRAIDLGERYLTEEKYEQAILQFTDAIEIAQREPEMVQLETEARDGLTAAVRIGAAAQTRQPGTDVQDAVTWLEQVECRDLEPARPFVEALTLLEQLRDYCAAEDYDSAFGVLSDEGYKETAAELMGLDCAVRLFDDTTGQLTAIYGMEVSTENFSDSQSIQVTTTAETAMAAIDTNYMVYYGGHDGDSRSGEGVWLAYQNGNNYLSRGTWVDDRPNGEFEVRSWQQSLDASVVYRVISGNVADGLWDGTVSWSFERTDGTDSYEPAFEKGIWVVLREENGYLITADNGESVLGVSAEDQGRTYGIAGYADVA